jgi:hypothetical protein
LAFPAQPPWPSCRSTGLRGPSPGRTIKSKRLIGTALMTFCLSFGDAFPVHAVRSSSSCRQRRSTLNYSYQYELPLLGFPKIAPLPIKVCCVLSKRTSRRGSTLGMRLPSLIHGPFSSFLTTSTVCSASHRAGLLHPAAGCGVRHVSGLRRQNLPMQAPFPSIDSVLPQWRLTLRSLPLDKSSCHVTATDSLSLFQFAADSFARRKRRAPAPLHGPANLRALLRCRVRCSSPTLPPMYCPLLPWA